MYDKDYFENGPNKGVSCYENYRWLPELTVPMCKSIVKTLGIKKTDRILDYGCAKGYIVRALRELGFQYTHGADISEYAICNCDPSVAKNLVLLHSGKPLLQQVGVFDWLICKDVLEHISYADLPAVVAEFATIANNVFIVVPLGQNGKYTISEYELDVTHKIREGVDWWKAALENAGFDVSLCVTKFPGVKDNWAMYENGNAFLVATRKNA